MSIKQDRYWSERYRINREIFDCF